jgi:hypothetical protein
MPSASRLSADDACLNGFLTAAGRILTPYSQRTALVRGTMESVTAAESLIHQKRLTVERLGAAVVLRLKSLSMGRSRDSK